MKPSIPISDSSLQNWKAAGTRRYRERERWTRKLDAFDRMVPIASIPDRSVLLSLAQDLPTVWQASATDMRVKQRIVRILIHEIIADVDEAQQAIVLVIHWAGGRHSELQVKRNKTGGHRRCTTSVEAIDVVRQMRGGFRMSRSRRPSIGSDCGPARTKRGMKVAFVQPVTTTSSPLSIRSIPVGCSPWKKPRTGLASVP
jgi:hypothetical protein